MFPTNLFKKIKESELRKFNVETAALETWLCARLFREFAHIVPFRDGVVSSWISVRDSQSDSDCLEMS
jgi:hypothetical protein